MVSRDINCVTRVCSCVLLMLGRRLRPRPNIKSTQNQRLVFEQYNQHTSCISSAGNRKPPNDYFSYFFYFPHTAFEVLPSSFFWCIINIAHMFTIFLLHVPYAVKRLVKWSNLDVCRIAKKMYVFLWGNVMFLIVSTILKWNLSLCKIVFSLIALVFFLLLSLQLSLQLSLFSPCFTRSLNHVGSF